MQLLTELAETPARLGLLPGSFNPPTRAHMGLARAALTRVNQVLLVLPGTLPHKNWDGASRDERVQMLRKITQESSGIGAAVSEGGLFIEMVREARILFPRTEFYLICGRDAAERIIEWNYGSAHVIEQMLTECRILVSPRDGPYVPPDHLAHAVETLDADCWDEYSSTRVRFRTGDWRELVPESILSMVETIYQNSPPEFRSR